MVCGFCSANDYKERQRIIWRGTHCYALLSNPELQVKMHMLIIPYQHITHLSELTRTERQDLFDTAITFQQKIRESGPGLGCDLRQNDRPFLLESNSKKVDGVPTKMDHVHIHLILRSYNDRLYQEVQHFEKFIMVPPEEMRLKEAHVKQLLSLP